MVGLAEDARKASRRTGKGAARPKPVSRAKPAGRKNTVLSGGGTRKTRKT